MAGFDEPVLDLPTEAWAKCELIVGRFESAWRQGDRPWIDDYLSGEGPARAALLIELIHTDLEFRLKAGEPARIEEYLKRYPELNGSGNGLLGLIEAEYRLRRRNGEPVVVDELCRRFPTFRDQLESLVQTVRVGPPASSGRLSCPQCRSQVEVNEATEQAPCPSCGTVLLLDRATVIGARLEHQRLGKYELLEVVGRGAFGIVYRARDTELDRIVAVKVPRRGGPITDEDVDRFLREARSAAQLRHPNIVAVHDAGRAEDTCYLVSEFVPGTTLADRAVAAQLTFGDVATLIAQVAEAVHYAHQQGVIHRDLKPSNLLLDEAGQPHVLDFGLARRDAGEITLTLDGEILGTPAYMSPEQARGEGHRVDARSDVYSLGVILYEFLTGELPFRGSPQGVLWQVLSEEPRPPRRINDHIPRDLETICLKCLEKAPHQRYSSAAALAEDLRRFLAREPILARPAGPLERLVKWTRRRPALTASLIVLGLTLFALMAAGFWLARWEQQKAELIARQEAQTRRKNYVLEINQAYRDWEDFRLEQALDRLDTLRPRPGQSDLRGFEWYHLWDQCHRDRPLRGHTLAILCLAFSPDDRWLASGSQDGTVRLWDRSSWKSVRTLSQGVPVRSLAFLPDSAALITAGEDGSVRHWDVETGQPRARFQPHKGSILCMALSPDGSTLATATNNVHVWLWDRATEKALAALSGHRHSTWGLAFTPDGKWLASANADRQVILWNLDTRQLKARLEGHSQAVNAVAFAPDGRLLASGSDDRTVRLWDRPTGNPLATMEGQEGPVLSLAFDREGSLLAVGSWGPVNLWDPRTQQLRANLPGHTGRVHAVAFAEDGRTLATAGDDAVIRLWDTQTARPLLRTRRGTGPAVLGPYPDQVFGLAFSPEGQLLAVATGTMIKMMHLTERRELHTLQGHRRQVWPMAFLSDGKALVSSGGDRTVKLWDVVRGECLATHGKSNRSVYSMAVSPDERIAVTGGGFMSVPGEAKVWDLESGQLLADLPDHADCVRALAFSPDGRTVVSGTRDGVVKFWDAETWQVRYSFQGHREGVFAAAFSPDGSLLATGSQDRTVKLWDAVTGRERATLRGHTGQINAVAFTPDGKRLASGSHDRTVILWDLATGLPLTVLRGPKDRVNCVAFSPDGRALAAGSFDQHVYLWYAPSAAEAQGSAVE